MCAKSPGIEFNLLGAASFLTTGGSIVDAEVDAVVG